MWGKKSIVNDISLYYLGNNSYQAREVVAVQKVIRGQKGLKAKTPGNRVLPHQSLPNNYAGYYFTNILIRQQTQTLFHMYQHMKKENFRIRFYESLNCSGFFMTWSTILIKINTQNSRRKIIPNSNMHFINV